MDASHTHTHTHRIKNKSARFDLSSPHSVFVIPRFYYHPLQTKLVIEEGRLFCFFSFFFHLWAEKGHGVTYPIEFRCAYWTIWQQRARGTINRPEKKKKYYANRQLGAFKTRRMANNNIVLQIQRRRYTLKPTLVYRHHPWEFQYFIYFLLHSKTKSDFARTSKAEKKLFQECLRICGECFFFLSTGVNCKSSPFAGSAEKILLNQKKQKNTTTKWDLCREIRFNVSGNLFMI